jgi:Zn ribbon nucleic-acid-binding protein
MNELYCPKCDSDEVYYDRIVPERVKHWNCVDCGYEGDSEEDFNKKYQENTICYRVYFDEDGITWFTDPVYKIEDTKPMIEFRKQNPEITNIKVIKEITKYEEVTIKE